MAFENKCTRRELEKLNRDEKWNLKMPEDLPKKTKEIVSNQKGSKHHEPKAKHRNLNWAMQSVEREVTNDVR